MTTQSMQLEMFAIPKPRYCVVRSNEGGVGCATLPGCDDLLHLVGGQYRHLLTVDTKKGDSIILDAKGNAVVKVGGRATMYRGRDGVRVVLGKVGQ